MSNSQRDACAMRVVVATLAMGLACREQGKELPGPREYALEVAECYMAAAVKSIDEAEFSDQAPQVRIWLLESFTPSLLLQLRQADSSVTGHAWWLHEQEPPSDAPVCAAAGASIGFESRPLDVGTSDWRNIADVASRIARTHVVLPAASTDGTVIIVECISSDARSIAMAHGSSEEPEARAMQDLRREVLQELGGH